MSVSGLLKNIPFVRFSAALAAGIYVSVSLKGIQLPCLLFAIGLTVVLLLVVVYVPFVFQDYRNRWLPGALFFCFLVQTGMFLAGLSLPSSLHGEYKVEATAKVAEAGISGSGYFHFMVSPLNVTCHDPLPLKKHDKWHIIVEPGDSAEDDLPARPGDKICFSTRLSGHEEPTNPSAFDYGEYLYQHGISGSGFVKTDDLGVLEEEELIFAGDRLQHIRQKARQVYKDYGITGERLQILSALTLGMRRELSDEVRTRFVHSGAVHILAVSGLHVGIVFLFLNAVLGIFLPRQSLAQMLIVITGLIFFALLAGGTPSVFRAVVMLSVIQVGKFFNRRGNIYNLLGISAFVILLVEPMSLFHAGFWLSHLAVAGIVTFYPQLRKVYAGNNVLARGPGDLAAVSLSAQIGTFPLSVYLFRAFPAWFLLTNFLLLPLVAPVLVLAKMLIGFSEFPFMGAMLAGVLNDLLGFMNEMVVWLDSLPSAYIKGLWIGSGIMLILYLMMASIALWWYHKYPRFLKIALIALFGVILAANIMYHEKRQKDAFVVLDVGTDIAIGVIRSGKGAVYASPGLEERELAFAGSAFFAKHAMETERQDLVADESGKEVQAFRGPKGVYIGVGQCDVDQIRPNPGDFHEISGIVLMDDVDGDVAGLLERFDCKRLIVTGGCPPWSVQSWLKDVMSMEVRVHNVPESGAYVEIR
ncbi:MAG: ComEC/Rec2 family competence protein [Marinilabilia sp.]